MRRKKIKSIKDIAAELIPVFQSDDDSLSEVHHQPLSVIMLDDNPEQMTPTRGIYPLIIRPLTMESSFCQGAQTAPPPALSCREKR